VLRDSCRLNLSGRRAFSNANVSSPVGFSVKGLRMEPGVRSRAARALGNYFDRKRWPRLSLGLVVMLTGAAGFAISAGLLRLGVEAMWIRYPVAVLAAYGIFLGLLRGWVAIERRHFDIEDPEVLAVLAENVPDSAPVLAEERRSSWWNWLDFPSVDAPDSAEGCGLGILVVAVIALVLLIGSLVAGAPVLVAEVAVDTFIVSVLYRRLKAAEREHWLGAAVRKTGWHAVATAALLAIVGKLLALVSPDAKTLGEAVRIWWEN
jgi:hypothetical protein